LFLVKRKRRSERDSERDRSPKTRKIIKYWDDETIEESEIFDIEDKENSLNNQ